MPDLLSISAEIIDSGVVSDRANQINRVTQELSEVGDGLAVVESFSHIWGVDTGDGLVLFDASSVITGADAMRAMRGWRTDRVDTLVYTHGHVDHVGGSGAVMADADRRGYRRPTVVAHEAVHARLDRYRKTNQWNLNINARQFGGTRTVEMKIGGDETDRLPSDHFLPEDVATPDVTYREVVSVRVGDVEMELHHARGETDDHTWTWLPDRKAVMAGDLFIWNFPNAGNPQKVQRHPGKWAKALREIMARRPELLLPAHGLPVGGVERVALVLDNTATALEHLVESTLSLMNNGADLDTIIHSVSVPPDLAELPYLMPFYDEPEFVVRNIWRLYGGWWDGDPSSLKPSPRARVASEVAGLAGGPTALAQRALVVADDGDLPLACHLVEMAADAAPLDAGVHEIRAEIYTRRRREATSLMARGIYRGAIRESQAVIGD